MKFKLAALFLLVVFLAYLVRRIRPSRFGLVFGLFLIYLPLHLRLPLNVLPLVNALTGFLIVLTLLLPWGGSLGKRSSGFLALVLLYFGVSLIGLVISLACGEEAGRVVVDLKRWLEPALFGLLALGFARQEDRKFAAACISFAYTLVCVQAVREGIDLGPQKRISGLLGQPNMTGSFIATYTPLVLALSFSLRERWARWSLLGAVLLGGWGLVFTDSRASMIGYAGGVIAILFASRRPALAALGLAAILTVYLAPAVLPDRVTARFQETVMEEEDPRASERWDEGDLEPSAAKRVKNWKASLRAISENPLGHGFSRYKGIIGKYGGVSGLDAHNIFLLVGVELGVLAVVLVIAFFLKTGADARAVFRRAADPFTRALGMGAMAMVIPAVVVNFFGSRLMQEMPSSYLWVLAGMAAVLRDSLAGEAEPSRSLPPPPLAVAGKER